MANPPSAAQRRSRPNRRPTPDAPRRVAFDLLRAVDERDAYANLTMPGLLAADVPALCEAAGLVNARWVAFDERGAGRLAECAWPQRAEWHFPWAVLEAEKPAARAAPVEKE